MLNSENNLSAEPIFEIKQASFAYDGKELALENINLTIHAGECLVILGANGCGKSTLLKLLRFMDICY